MKTSSQTISPKIAILYLLIICAAISAMVAVVVPEALFTAVGLVAFLLVAGPLLVQKQIDLFSPWSFITLTVFLGCTATGICLSLRWPDEDRIEALLLLGESPSFFIYPSIVLLLGLASLACGYYGTALRTERRHAHGVTRWNPVRLQLLVFVLFLISLAATYGYVHNTGGLASGQLSGKRTVIFDVDIQGDTDFNQFGPLRQLGKLASFGYLFLLAHCLFQSKKFTPGNLFALLLLFVLSCALPFYSSSRLPIVWLFVATIALVWYSGHRVKWMQIAVIGLIGLTVFNVMSAIRGKSEVLANLEDSSSLGRLVDAMVLTRNYAGLAKTSHIINSVPEVLDLEYGKTFAVWLVAPVPRSLWADKPLIHSGPIIGTKVFGEKVTGVPPGLIAELYWNFHIPGVVIGAWLFGTLLRWMTSSLKPIRGQADLYTVVYVVGPMRFGFEVMGNSFGFGLVITMLDMLTAITLLHMIRAKRVTAKDSRHQQVVRYRQPVPRAAA